MKKLLVVLLALVMVLAMVSCGQKEEPEVKGEGVMTYEEYAAAKLDTEVVVECYVQGHQSWWTGNAGTGVCTIYAQDKTGGYFIYEANCSEELANKLVPGTKIKVTGYKSEWAGEVEIVDGQIEVLEGSYVAKATDVTDKLGTDELVNFQNQKIALKGMTVTKAALFKWDGSGQDGDDLYFNVSLNDKEYTFTVESYLCGKGTEVYEAVKALEVGQTVDLEGFCYWYEGVQPHITAVTVK